MRVTDNIIIDIIAGISLALILPTSYRITASIGFGEIGLAASTIAGFDHGTSAPAHAGIRGDWRDGTVLVAYAIFILLPVTLLFTVLGTEGSSTRDWAAYMLSFSFILSLVVRPARIKIIVACLVLALIPLLSYQYFMGGANAWYSFRFTGGANNPNQLIYIVCAIALVWGGLRHPIVRWVVCGVLFLFGLRTLSDAYLAYIATVSVVLLIGIVFPRKLFVKWSLPLVLFVISCGLILVPI